MITAQEFLKLKKQRKKKSKFRAKRCEYDGHKFPSLLERNCYIQFKRLLTSGIIDRLEIQVTFQLPGKVKHRVDFKTYQESNIKYFESKGRDIYSGRIKRAMVEDLFKIKIHLITAPHQIAQYFSCHPKIS